MNRNLCCDVIVVGGGSAATLAALAAARQGLETVLLQHATPHTSLIEDGRVFALTSTTWNTLDRWEVLSAAGKARAVAMSGMNLFFQHFESPVYISAWKQELPALSYLYSNKDLLQDCEAALDACSQITRVTLPSSNPAQYTKTNSGWHVSGLEIQSNQSHIFTIDTTCLVIAEGAQSRVREQIGFEPISHTEQIDYGQSAIVCAFSLQKHHHGLATQWFLQNGATIALLPTQVDSKDVLSLVWSAPHHTEFLQQLNQNNIVRHLQAQLGSQLCDVYGELGALTSPHTFALKRVRHERVIHHHALLLGDAASTVHPLAGMGFNLVMGDLLIFEQSLKELAQGKNIKTVLQDYQQRMKQQRMPIEWMVDGMFALNRPKHAMLSTAWGLAGALKSSSWLQNKFFESWIEPKLQRLLVHSFQRFTQPFVLERLKNRT